MPYMEQCLARHVRGDWGCVCAGGIGTRKGGFIGHRPSPSPRPRARLQPKRPATAPLRRGRLRPMRRSLLEPLRSVQRAHRTARRALDGATRQGPTATVACPEATYRHIRLSECDCCHPVGHSMEDPVPAAPEAALSQRPEADQQEAILAARLQSLLRRLRVGSPLGSAALRRMREYQALRGAGSAQSQTHGAASSMRSLVLCVRIKTRIGHSAPRPQRQRALQIDSPSIMDSGPYKFYMKWFYPLEHAVCRAWPGLLAFQFVVLSVPRALPSSKPSGAGSRKEMEKQIA